MKNIIVIYHKNCRDGIAGAWTANKKFGDTAEYIACDYALGVPEYVESHDNLAEVEIYVIDFSFSKEILLDLEKRCRKLVVLDHHISSKDAVSSVKEHVYGEGISGCYIAYQYFFPNQSVPLALQYVSDSDTWTHKMPDYEYIDAYIYRSDNELSIENFNTTVLELADESKFEEIKKIGKILREVYLGSVKKYIERAELIDFEGYKVYAVNAPSELKSELGHELAKMTGTFAIIYYFFDGFWRISLRSVEDFDVSLIAQRFEGGGGHKNAAAFRKKSINPMFFIKNI
jgi:uncharacterized protein